MVLRKTSKTVKLLTEVELELMNEVWNLGECTIKDVQDRLPKERPLAYTTVATMMKILEKKRVIGSVKKDKAHTYFPLLERVEYEARSLKHLSENVFQGEPNAMVMRLLNDSNLTQQELKNIRQLLNERIRS